MQSASRIIKGRAVRWSMKHDESPPPSTDDSRGSAIFLRTLDEVYSADWMQRMGGVMVVPVLAREQSPSSTVVTRGGASVSVIQTATCARG